MKLYGEDNPAPNPRRVRIFLAEKGVQIQHERIALRKGAHKSPEFKQKNSLGQVPVLELDDGTCISESISICRYLDDVFSDPPLFGSSAKERALIDMWNRRIEMQLMFPVGQFWRHAHPLTAPLLHQHKEFGESNRAITERVYHWLDKELAHSGYIAGENYSIADIVAQTTVDFGIFIGLPIPEACANVLAWHAKVSARPSSEA